MWPFKKRAPKPSPVDYDDLPESFLVTPSAEATDPRMWAIMRSLETGEVVSVSRDNDGVWRDGDGNEVPPR